MRLSPLLPILDPPALGLRPQQALALACARWPQQLLLRTRELPAVDEPHWLQLFESQYPGLLIANLGQAKPGRATTLRHYPQGSHPLRGPSVFGMSAHSLAAVEQACAAGAAWILLSPLRPTPSHHGHPGMTSDLRTQCVAAARDAGLQVFGLGGLGPTDLAWAQTEGLDGVAGIRSFFS